MLICIPTRQTTTQGAAEVSSSQTSRRDTAAEQLAMESLRTGRQQPPRGGNACLREVCFISCS